ncbi:ATP-binding cassette domain-containing protein [Sphingobium baderi]|uniref:ABC transporter n=1 Tax=Sphingobium baderi LL03 TaxID=1114964 RepID=T0HAX5_9SPHN|nr:ATP-binding cassette domain-containing protein [Sphingobium baderi]EQA96514.1 hypothetical protein L485_24325 [Sphingobium baderi LL03]KMS64423.1 hypothetical protein V475_08065 [Sphingobium baderi LL03]
MTHNSLTDAVEYYAHLRGISLPPGWSKDVEDADLHIDGSAPEKIVRRLCSLLGWDAPAVLHDRPRPDQFPLLVLAGDEWKVVEQWENEEAMRVAGLDQPLLPYDPALIFHALSFPEIMSGASAPTALSVFWRAIMKRKHVLIMAALATVFANIIALATSLYSMQLYDRVIPLGSFSTLWVLTAGVAVALAIDFVLRSLRSLMIEREAADIDAEVAEFFFAHSQSVRLDARPPGIGTMAAQLRGMEQVRNVMSSASLFLIADLPFALFFIVVIALLGGVVAIVPIISLPIALLLAFILGRMIQQGTNRAQVSGNRKNGMLVESLDAAESIKASRGGWFMLARWNRLVREVHHYEDPVKRVSAVAGTIFGTLQQVGYVAMMAVGAFEVGEGKMTSGALLACSIIGGRINGPLIAMLPNLMVQWGYARSSLRALDGILQLPLERTSGQASLRPENLGGAMEARNIGFAYAGARSGLAVDRLVIAPGERVAIIGGVGSGKTTLLRILAGLFHPQSGTIRLGGLDMTQIAEDVLRRHIGYLPQDFQLVHGSLRDNIVMGLGNVSDDAVMAVAQKTGLIGLISGHPSGLDLTIQEGGRGLSGGQRTLVGLTRLLLASPRLWLLDEPTANLDQNAENAILRALDEALSPEDTLIFVTHKLQLLGQVKRVILLGEGRVLLDGPTAEVIARLQGRPASSSRNAPSPIAAVKP